MGQQAVDKAINRLLRFVDDKYVRGELDKRPEVITITKKGYKASWIASYNALLKKGRGEYPSLESFVTDKLTAHIDTLFPQQKGQKQGGLITAFNNLRKGAVVTAQTEPDKIVVKSRGASDTDIYNIIKQPAEDYISKFLGRELTTADNVYSDEEIAAMQQDKRYEGVGQATRDRSIRARKYRASEVGLIRSSQIRLHRGSTTVGGGQLAKSFAYLQKSKFFSDFVKKSQFKSLKDEFGDIGIKFVTTGTDLRSKRRTKTTLKPDETVSIEMFTQEENLSNKELTDWERLKPKLINAINEYFTEFPLLDLKGSPSIKDVARNALIYTVASTLSQNRNTTATPKPRRIVRKKSKTTVTQKGKQKFSGPSPQIAVGAAGARRPKTQRGITSYPLQMIAILNRDLPKTVRNNMREPGLVNRSGRFAESAKVTDVIQTPQGFPSIGYQYARDPYEIFEMGIGTPPWATRNRDPRRVIEQSIREIAVQFALGRFYTRRL